MACSGCAKPLDSTVYYICSKCSSEFIDSYDESKNTGLCLSCNTVVVVCPARRCLSCGVLTVVPSSLCHISGEVVGDEELEMALAMSCTQPELPCKTETTSVKISPDISTETAFHRVSLPLLLHKIVAEELSLVPGNKQWDLVPTMIPSKIVDSISTIHYWKQGSVVSIEEGDQVEFKRKSKTGDNQIEGIKNDMRRYANAFVNTHGGIKFYLLFNATIPRYTNSWSF